MSKSALPTVAGGFTVLSFLAPSSSNVQGNYQIFVRPSKEDDCTLFACNIPWRSSSKDIKSAFEALLALNHPELAKKPITEIVLPPTHNASNALWNKEGIHSTTTKGKQAVPPLFVHPKAGNLADQVLCSSTAEIRFSSLAHVSAVLSCVKSIQWPKSKGILYSDLYSIARPSLEDVRAHTDAWMLQFDAPSQPSQSKQEQAEASKSKKRKRREAAMEDGTKSATTRNAELDEEDAGEWTKVERGGNKGRSKVDLVDTQVARPGTVKDKEAKAYGRGKASVGVASKKFLNGLQSIDGVEEGDDRPSKKRRNKVTGLTDFYTTKRDQSRAKNIADIQAKFEQDKERISKLQQPRKSLDK